jgi:hypothetical protein
MLIDRNVVQAALEALETCLPGDYSTGHVIHPYHDNAKCGAAETALRAALAAPQPARHRPEAIVSAMGDMVFDGDDGYEELLESLRDQERAIREKP